MKKLILSLLVTAGLIGSAHASDIPVTSLHVKAFIDGESQLIISTNGIIWYNSGWTSVPGRWNYANIPTTINNSSWYPSWPPLDSNWSFDGYSSYFTVNNLTSNGIDITPFTLGLPVYLQTNSARGSVFATARIISGTQATVIDFNDLPFGGADYYDITISISTNSLPPSTNSLTPIKYND